MRIDIEEHAHGLLEHMGASDEADASTYLNGHQIDFQASILLGRLPRRPRLGHGSLDVRRSRLRSRYRTDDLQARATQISRRIDDEIIRYRVTFDPVLALLRPPRMRQLRGRD